MPAGELCDGHQCRFHRRRRRKGLTLERFLRELANPGGRIYDLSGLPEPLKAELQFGLQCRSEQRATRMRHDVFGGVVDALVDCGYRSLPEAVPYIYDRLGPGSRRFVAFVCDRLDWLRCRHAGIEEWDRDEWRVDRLPIDQRARRGASRLSFSFCARPWLRALIKRWVRWRLSLGLGVSTASWNLLALRHFVEFCDEHDRPLTGPHDITRALLEDWLADETLLPVAVGTRARWLGSLRCFLDDVRRHDWAPGLTATATYHPREIPRRPESLPRFLEEPVIARLEGDDALDRLPDLTTRTLVQVLIETGLRAIDARTLTCQGRREFPTCDDGNSSPCGRPVRAGWRAAMASRWWRMR